MIASRIVSRDDVKKIEVKERERDCNGYREREREREREESGNSRETITLIGISGLAFARSRALMNARENRHNVGIHKRGQPRALANAVQSDCGLNERYYATSAGTK